MEKPAWSFRIYKYYKFQIIPKFYSNPLQWKDKFNTPRIERVPTREFQWLWWEFVFERGTEQQWEFYIWCKEYHNNNIQRAVDEWPWGTLVNGKWVRSNPLK